MINHDLISDAQIAPGLTDEPVCDALDRPLRCLRVSVIDRCNLHCPYCRPIHTEPNSCKAAPLSCAEIIRVVKIFVRIGVRRVRLTGGEPLLRPDLFDIIQGISRIPGVADLALTTNGSLLKSKASELKSAGLKRITVSLNTLDPSIFRLLCGGKGEITDVLDGIAAAQQTGFHPIKINAVILKNVNERGVLDLVKHFKGTGHIIRFIEYMDVGNCNHWQEAEVIPNAEILQRIQRCYPLEPVFQSFPKMGTASRYRFLDGSGEIGFISAISEPFCASCTRFRLSSEGKLYACLFAQEGFNLAQLLRNGLSDDEILEIIKSLWSRRDDCYSENRQMLRVLQPDIRKVEMYEIGG